MKKSLRLLVSILYIMLSADMCGQEGSGINGRAGLGIGTRAQRYPYPITDLSFRVVVFHDKALFDARLRAYGIKSIFGGRNYDLTAYFHKVWPIRNDLTCYAGGGAELMLRINGDDRSQATSGVQPMIMFGSMYYTGKFQFNVPVWTKFYRNGVSVSILPEPSYRVSDKFQLFLRYELSFLALYSGSSHNWRHDALLGTYVYF